MLFPHNSVTPQFHFKCPKSRSVNLNEDWHDPSAEGLDYSGGRKKKVYKTDKMTMKIPGSHPSFVTDISRVSCVYPVNATFSLHPASAANPQPYFACMGQRV